MTDWFMTSKGIVATFWAGISINLLISTMHMHSLYSLIESPSIIKGIIAVIALAINGWSAWFCYRCLRDYKRKEKQRVIDILSGRIG